MPQVRWDRGTPIGARGNALALDVDRRRSADAHFEKLKPGPGMNAVEVAGHQQARIHSAMVQLVAERGYVAVTVRDLARVAGVSTRSFYKHYPGKEQCFLRVHHLIARRVLRALDLPLEGPGREERVRLVVEAAMGELVSEPRATRLLLVDVYTAGPVALKQAQRARKSFEVAIGESLGTGLEGKSLSPLAAEGIVAGLHGVALRRLLTDQALPGIDLCAELAKWVLAYSESTSVEGLHPIPAPQVKLREEDTTGGDEREARERNGASMQKGDLGMLLNVAARLAASEDYKSLSSRKIIKAAGIPRRTFDSNFSSLEDCFCTVLEGRARDVMSRVGQASECGATPESGVCLAIAELCNRVASDAPFARLCFDDRVAPGVRKIHHRQAFIDDLVHLVDIRLNGERPVDPLRVEASVCAVWRAIQNQVTMGRAHEVAQKAPLLAYLLLAPIAGSPAAREAIQESLHQLVDPKVNP